MEILSCIEEMRQSIQIIMQCLLNSMWQWILRHPEVEQAFNFTHAVDEHVHSIVPCIFLIQA